MPIKFHIWKFFVIVLFLKLSVLWDTEKGLIFSYCFIENHVSTYNVKVPLMRPHNLKNVSSIFVCNFCMCTYNYTAIKAVSKILYIYHTDSKGTPRCITNSKGKKRRPASKELTQVVKTSDALFLDFIQKCLEYVNSLYIYFILAFLKPLNL